MTTEERLAKLERENRWMKLGGAVLLLALVAVLFVGAGQEKDKPKVLEEVRAKAFVVVDKNGKDRAYLGCREPGIPALSLIDKNGKDRACLGLSGSELGLPVLELRDPEELPRATIGINMTTRTGKLDDTPTTTHDPFIVLVDKEGDVLFKAPK